VNKGLLCVDVGNSRVKVGVFKGDELKEVRAFIPASLGTELVSLLNNPYEGVVLSSVVPSVTKDILKICRDKGLPEPFQVNHTRTGGLMLELKNPQTLGPDRLSAAAGAYARAGAPSVVVDAGTATTTTIVATGPKLLGGTIMPGIRMMLQALHEKTAALPEVEPFQWDGPFGNDTKSSIMAGVLFGTVGMIERVLKEVEALYGKATVFLTGGQAELLKPYLREAILEPHLTLYGMKYIFERRSL
jgi:type III pantothenate kinase